MTWDPLLLLPKRILRCNDEIDEMIAPAGALSHAPLQLPFAKHPCFGVDFAPTATLSSPMSKSISTFRSADD